MSMSTSSDEEKEEEEGGGVGLATVTHPRTQTFWIQWWKNPTDFFLSFFNIILFEDISD